MTEARRADPGSARRHGLGAIALAALALLVAVAAWLRAPDAREPAPGSTAEHPGAPADVASLQQELAALRQHVSQLDLGGSRSEVVDQDRIKAMVEEALAARGNAALPGAGQAPAPRLTATATAAAALAQELAQTPFGARRDELWKQLRALGAVDAAVAWFERLAATSPDSPDAQTELGAAYVEQLLQTTDEQQRIEIGKKIDAQYDKALELQPDHWEARFRKAVGLSYGPALSGRRSEAIAQFERLVQQQATMPAQPGYAETYLYLGRLYEQQGDSNRATAIWQQGLARHPQDPELRSKVGR